MIAMAKPHQRRQSLAMTHYVVLWVKTRELLYSGRSIDTVAELLEPGTCHGQGRTESEARTKADALASRAERAGAILVACGRRPVPQHRPLTWMERDVYEPTEDEIERACRAIRERGFTDHKGHRYQPWGNQWDKSA